jgi:hypothetical protein
LASKKGRKGRFVTSRGLGTGKTRVGLGKLIVGYDLEKGDFIIQTEGIEISSTFKKRLEKILNMLSPTNFKKTEAKYFGK